MRIVQLLALLPLIVVTVLALGCGPVSEVSGESANDGGFLPPATGRPTGLDAYLQLPSDQDAVSFPYSEVVIERADGSLELGVLVANTGQQRQRGLMFWTGLPTRMGMIFIWEGGGERRGGFWNRNVPMDLTVAFLDADGVILDFVMLDAESDEVKSPSSPYMFALEVPRGRFAKLGVGLGDRVSIPPALLAE